MARLKMSVVLFDANGTDHTDVAVSDIDVERL